MKEGCETVIGFVLELALTVLGTFLVSLGTLSGLILNMPGTITLALFTPLNTCGVEIKLEVTGFDKAFVSPILGRISTFEVLEELILNIPEAITLSLFTPFDSCGVETEFEVTGFDKAIVLPILERFSTIGCFANLVFLLFLHHSSANSWQWDLHSSSSGNIYFQWELFPGSGNALPLIPIHIAKEERIRRKHADYINRMEMLFTINPCPHPSVNANINIESFPSLPIPIHDNDSQWKEIDIVISTDDVLPPGVENDDSDGEINAIDDLRVDNSISNSKHESSECEALRL
uniref:Reverse transcriptase domain-containing protein n=1 Tax=Tanacetum cinerariifolium TaxID=118510 RepID=A0A699KMR9_TANCI|nr:hypothetical protein [Tanacetum cinerariifolium]